MSVQSDSSDAASAGKHILEEVDRVKLDQVEVRRHTAIRPLWEKYEKGEYTVAPDYMPDTTIELISADDLHVDSQESPMTGELCYIDVTNDAAEERPGVNFMGFDPKQRCLAFRGEARHLDRFLDFGHELIQKEGIKGLFKAPSEVKIPKAGLKPNLSYDEFAGRVEIVEYAMWLVATTQEESAATDAFESLTIVSPDDSPVDEESTSEGSPTRDALTQLPMEIDGGSMRPSATLIIDDVRSTDSSLSELSDMDDDVDLGDVKRSSMDQSIADVYSADVSDNSRPSSPTRASKSPTEQERVARQVEADAALAESLAAASGRYSLRRRSIPASTATPEPIPVPKASDEESNKGKKRSEAKATPKARKGMAVKKKKTRRN